MKRSLIAILMLLSSTVAFGDSAPSPDYSRDAILKVLHDGDVRTAPFKFNVGTVDINTPSTRYHLAYLPLLAPLPYSGPNGARDIPNPFVLTHTEFAWQPGQYKALPADYENDREYRREYKRVARMIANMQ